jgi:RNA-binding protein
VDTAFKKTLKAKAHHLKPVILIGAKGLTPAVTQETDGALLVHELIKVKVSGADKTARLEMMTELCKALQADLVQLIGNTAVIYREKPQS